jgi:hypothetical protein
VDPSIPAEVFSSLLSSPIPVSNVLPARSRDLLPLRIHPQQRANRTRDAHDAVIELGPAQRRRGNGDVAQVAQQLQTHGIYLARELLRLDDGLGLCGFRRRELGAALTQAVELVQRGDDAEGYAREPGLVALADEPRRGRVFVDVCGVELRAISRLSSCLVSRSIATSYPTAGSW